MASGGRGGRGGRRVEGSKGERRSARSLPKPPLPKPLKPPPPSEPPPPLQPSTKPHLREGSWTLRVEQSAFTNSSQFSEIHVRKEVCSSVSL